METIAIYCLKIYSIDNKMTYLIIGGILYFIIAIIFSNALESNKIANINVYWNISSTILTIALGYYFSECLSTTNIIGIGICLIGIVVMNL